MPGLIRRMLGCCLGLLILAVSWGCPGPARAREQAGLLFLQDGWVTLLDPGTRRQRRICQGLGTLAWRGGDAYFNVRTEGTGNTGPVKLSRCGIQPRAHAEVLLEEAGQLNNASFNDLSLSPDQSKLYFCVFASQRVGVLDCKTLRVTELKGVPQARFISASPDGRRILFVQPENQLNVQDLRTGAVQVLKKASAEKRFDKPVWSPDGNRLILPIVENRDGTTGELKVLRFPPADEGTTVFRGRLWGGSCWSPDGRYIVFTSFHDRDYQLFKVAAVGSTAPEVLVKGMRPQWQ